MKPATYTLEDFEAVFGPKALMAHSEYCYFHDTANTAIKLIEDNDTEQLQSLFESGPLHDGDTLSTGDTKFSNTLKFLTESFGPSSKYPLLKTFPQPGNESWTWLHRITQKTSDRYILIRDDTILSVLLFKYPQLTP